MKISTAETGVAKHSLSRWCRFVRLVGTNALLGRRGEGMRADRLDEDVLAAFFYFAFSFFKTWVGGDEMLLSYAKDPENLSDSKCLRQRWMEHGQQAFM